MFSFQKSVLLHCNCMWFLKASIINNWLSPECHCFIHPYGSQFPLNNRGTLQGSANPELTHSQSCTHSHVMVWGYRGNGPLHNLSLTTGLTTVPATHGPQSHWPLSLPVAPPRGYSIGGKWPVSIRQPPTPVNHTKSTLNLSKSSNLLCGHSIQPRGLRASPHFQLGCSLKGPPAETLEPNTFCPHIQHSSFCASFRVRSSVLSFTLMICLIINHTLSLEHTFPNLAPLLQISPIQSTWLPD